MTNSTTLDRRSPTAEQVLSIANKSLYLQSGERTSAKKLASNLPPLTRKELTELIKHGLSATLDEESFLMKTSAKPSSGRSSHHRHHHHSTNPVNDHHHHHHHHDGTTKQDETKAKKRKSAEEIFYATINGEEISVSDEGLEPEEEEVIVNSNHVSTYHEFEDDENNDHEFPDSFSFANFDLIKDERMGELLKHDIPVDFFSKSEWAREERNKRGTTYPGSPVAEESGSSGGETTTTSCSIQSDEDDLSITDIKEYVMEHLSDEVKSIISEETWTRILNKLDHADDEEGDDEIGSVMTTKSTKDALKRLLKKSRSKQPSVDIDVIESGGDDTSLVSDMTAHTAMVKREEEQKNKKHVSFQTEEAAPRSKDQNNKFGYPSPLAEQSDGCSRKEASVKFSHIDVRYYERILDLNPSVTNGPPIGIGWRYRKGTSYTIEEWEMERREDDGKRPRTAATTAGPRSAASHLILPRAVREKMLYDLGYTQQDIAQALRTVRKLKDQRRTTVDNLKAQSVEEAVEKATTLMKNMLRVGKKRGVVR